MAEYVYPAIFHPNQDDGSYTILFPDLPGCISEGKNLGNALYMAQSALSQWIDYAIDEGLELAPASDAKDSALQDGEFINYIRVESRDERAVKRTISIPKWMDDKLNETNLSLSRFVQNALKRRFKE